MPQADASSLDCFLLAQAPVFDTSWFGFARYQGVQQGQDRFCATLDEARQNPGFSVYGHGFINDLSN